MSFLFWHGVSTLSAISQGQNYSTHPAPPIKDPCRAKKSDKVVAGPLTSVWGSVAIEQTVGRSIAAEVGKVGANGALLDTELAIVEIA